MAFSIRATDVTAQCHRRHLVRRVGGCIAPRGVSTNLRKAAITRACQVPLKPTESPAPLREFAHCWAQKARPGTKAVAVNIEIMRTFVKVRQLAATHGDLARRLVELEDKTEALAMQHDTFSRNTRAQLKQVFDALRELATPPDPPKRPIGFVTPEDKGKKAAGPKGGA